MHRFPGLQIYGKCIKKKELCSVKNKIITRRNGDEMEDYSIANTTKEQRIALIRQWIPDEDGLGDSGDMICGISTQIISTEKEKLLRSMQRCQALIIQRRT